MKILLLSHQFYPFIGGIEVNSEVLATEFSKAGHEVTIMTWTPQKGDKKFPFAVVRKPTLKRLLQEYKNTDMVFENNPSLRLSWPLYFFKKPHVIALRTWISRSDGNINLQDKLKFRWLRNASAVIAISEAVRKKTWLPAIVIGNPYRNDLFVSKPNISRKNDFVFLGRLVSDKGADIAIEAFYQFLRKKEFFNYDGKITIIGDGPENAALQNLAASLNLAGRVYFTGALRGEALVNELNEHSYLLVPSRWEEPFGNVALEGMACGCIPVVSDGGGLPDAVGDAGLVFKRNNADDLAEKMQLLLSDSLLAARLNENAGQHLLNHRPEIVARKYLDVIQTAAGK